MLSVVFILSLTVVNIIVAYAAYSENSSVSTDSVSTETVLLQRDSPSNQLLYDFSSFLDSSNDYNFIKKIKTPKDRIKESQILVLNDRVTIDLHNAEWSTFLDTKSMEPTLGAGSNAIQLIPQSEADIDLGDIVSYETKEHGTIIHRVIEKGYDEEGVYFILKGDNNEKPDPLKVRFKQIRRVVVAIIY